MENRWEKEYEQIFTYLELIGKQREAQNDIFIIQNEEMVYETGNQDAKSGRTYLY